MSDTKHECHEKVASPWHYFVYHALPLLGVLAVPFIVRAQGGIVNIDYAFDVNTRASESEGHRRNEFNGAFSFRPGYSFDAEKMVAKKGQESFSVSAPQAIRSGAQKSLSTW
jgi:hypothetical protein